VKPAAALRSLVERAALQGRFARLGSVSRPNVLVILTDQLRYLSSYESDELREHRRPGEVPGYRPPAVA
jgi:hypothetical protein